MAGSQQQANEVLAMRVAQLEREKEAATLRAELERERR